MKNILHHSAEFIAKHKRHHHLIIALLVIAVAATGGVVLYKKIAKAATFTFTQASWAGGETANTAVHPTNQSSWTQYASSTGVTAGTTVVLSSTGYAFTDDGATSTTPTASTAGGGFSSAGVINASTTVSGSGAGASVGLGASGALTALATPTIATGNKPQSVIISPDGTSVYAANVLGSTISMYSRNTSTGALTALATPTIATGVYPYSIAISADGTSVYAANGGSATVSMYSRNTSTGALTALATPSIATNTGPRAIAVSADGTSVYVANGDAATVSMYSRNTSTGALTALATPTIAAGANPFGITISADGTSVYAANYTSNTVSIYSRNTSTGALTALATPTIAAGANPFGITISADGTSVYAANALDNTISMYSRNTSTGALTALVTPTIAAGTSPRAITISADGTSVYAANYTSNTVSMYSRNTSTGALIALATPTIAAGTNPYGIAISADGTSVYAANYNANTISMYSRGPSIFSGTFTSAVINLGAKASFTTLSAASTTPSGTAITIAVRAGNSLTLSGGYTTISNGDISAFAGNQYIQYQVTLSTPNPAVTPTLDSVTVNYSQYGSGDLTSSKYDIGSDAVISKLTWVASTSTTETVRFQMQSSPNNVTWTGWCGYDETGTTCNGSNYFTDAHNGVTLGTSHPLRSTTGGGLADRYFQYKVFLGSGGSATPTLTSVTVQYVVNAPPEVQNVTAVQNADGTVTVHFDMRDTDTNDAGAATPGKVISTLQYNNAACGAGPNWFDATAVAGDAGANTTITPAYPTVASSTIIWTPSTDWSDKYCATQQIRIKLNDSEGANNYGYSSAGSFALDSKIPTVSYVRVDSSATNNPITWSTTDDTALSYRLSNSAFASFVSNETAWTATTTGANGINWPTLTGTPNSETVYYQFRDAYGNGVSGTIVAPAMPANFLATDTTNPTDGTYREFLSWGVASTTPPFGSYQVWSKIGGGGTYSLLASVSPVTQNSYLHTITTATSSEYFYKVVMVSQNGDVSEFTSPTSDTPDGSGSADITPPYITAIATSSIGNTSANITFGTYSDSYIVQGELATSTVRYASYAGSAPTNCPVTSSVSSNTYVVNHSVYLTGLEPSTNYVFCVLAKNIANYTSTPSSVSSAGGTFTTVGGPKITGVTEREVTDISATIFWNTDTSSDSKVYYATTPAGVNGATPVTGAIVTTAGTNANGTFYQHQIGLTGLLSGLTYYYKVVSADASVPPNTTTDDNLGQYYSFVTLKDTTRPTITGTSTPVLAPTAAVIVWQTDEMATSKVDYGTTLSTYDKGVAENSNHSIYHVVTLSSGTVNSGGAGGDNLLVKETPYYYRVTSKDAANNEATATGTFTTPADGNVTITVVNVVNSAGDTTKDTTAPAISNVKVSDITPFSAVVSFDTSEAAVSFVDYGKDTSYGDSAGDKVYGTTHTVKLRGLSLGTEYHTKVTAHDKAGNTGTSADQTFKTTFLSENLKDMTKIENIEQFQKEIEDTIESILPSLVPPFVSKPTVTDITENGATVSFRTNIRSFPVVGFVEDALYDATKENPYAGEVSDMTEKSLDHTVALIGLKQNTKYRVQARAFSLPKVIGKSADITFTTKASKISGSIIERKKDSFTVVWTTDEPTSSVVEYRNTASGITERKTDDAKRTSHSMRVDNLPSGTTYAVDISGLNEQGNVVEAGASLTVTTSRDVTAPVISGFKVDNALVPGRTDRIQTIVSWKTDEPSNSTTYYEEGAGTAGDTKELVNKNEVLDSYITAHSVILPNLKPGTIYRLKVTSSDDSGNEASFGPRTVITPRQTESITDIIFKNFEDSFKFLRDI